MGSDGISLSKPGSDATTKSPADVDQSMITHDPVVEDVSTEKPMFGNSIKYI
jgi:hypothetical protein